VNYIRSLPEWYFGASNMRYIVTGGAGFIGSHLCEALAGAGHEVAIIDDLSSGKKEYIAPLLDKKNVTFYQDTISDFAFLAETFRGADGIFHQAAMVSVPKSIMHPLANHEINLTGTLNVLLAARDAAVRKVVFASSAAVYGNIPDQPKTEEMTPDPLSPYALAKVGGEHYCRLFSRLYGLPTVALRYFNVYGPRQDPHSEYAAVIPKFIAHLAGGEPPLIYGDGEQTRDFVYVKDVVQANQKAMEGQAVGTYNVGCGEETSVNNLAETMIALFRSSLRARHTEERPGEVKHSVADITRAKKDLGYSPECSLEQGLAETLQYYDRQFRKATGQKM
jgi:nucleoside-diphosphate-sugar epimerase